jgi:uncharacterized protein Yka (UPF0111/DUF47 family)
MFGAASRHDQVFYQGFREHADRLLQASQLLESSLKGADGTDEKRDRIRTLRTAGEKIARNMIGELRRTWITPFEPHDIRALILALDEVLAGVHASAERVAAFPLHDADGEGQRATELASFLVRCCGELQRAVGLMGEKRKDDEILLICEGLRRLEHESGEAYRAALKGLYREEGGEERQRHVLDLLRWRELFDKIEEATDRCGRVAQEIETIVEGHA